MTPGDFPELRASSPTVPWVRRVVRWLVTPVRPFIVVLVPDRFVAPDVAAGRYGWPLLTVIACACVAAFTLGTRLDLGPEVRAENAGAPAVAATTTTSAKPAEIKTDREIDEAITERTTVARVKLGLGAALGTPFRVLALGFVMLLLGRFVGGKPTMPRVADRRGAGLGAGRGALAGDRARRMAPIQAWFPTTSTRSCDHRSGVPDGHPVLARLLAGVDVFTLWSVVILAFGLCAAADIRRRKSVIAIAIGFVLYLAVTRLIMGGAEPAPGVGGR